MQLLRKQTVTIFRGFFLLLGVFFLLSAKPPSLTPHDTKVKIEEIFHAHVEHRKLTPELVQRSFLNFLDELDPNKVYLLKSEITAWENPSDGFLDQALKNYRREDFSQFQQLHEIMITAIKRRGKLEEKIDKEAPLEDVNIKELKDLDWCDTEDALAERLKKIRAVQLDVAKKFDKETQEQFNKRVERRRINRENDLSGVDHKEKKQVMLSLVLKAISSALDSQTSYFTPFEATQFMMQMQQRLFGIGAQLKDNFNGLTIVHLLEGGPAILGNELKVGDRIIAVDNQPIIGMEIVEAVELIRGKEGTKVLLTVLRPGPDENAEEEKLDISIRRGEIVLNEGRYEVAIEPLDEGVIAHLSLHTFYQDPTTSSANDLKQAIETLKKEHDLKGIVLDLRSNAGGLITESVAVTGLFIQNGVVVSVKDNTQRIQRLRNIDQPVWDGPLIVLVNRASASASEIVAQTLQDYGRAIIVGDMETFGKGTFQVFTLETTHFDKVNPKGEYKVTRGLYYTVSGKSPQLTGVTADIPVPGVFDKIEIGERFTKYPLETASIPPAFFDDLSDISPLHRHKVSQIYGGNLQPVLATYTPHIETLRTNSAKRLAENNDYQAFLQKAEEEELASEVVDSFVEHDLQYREAANVLLDLISLLEEEKEVAHP